MPECVIYDTKLAHLGMVLRWNVNRKMLLSVSIKEVSAYYKNRSANPVIEGKYLIRDSSRFCISRLFPEEVVSVFSDNF